MELHFQLNVWQRPCWSISAIAPQTPCLQAPLASHWYCWLLAEVCVCVCVCVTIRHKTRCERHKHLLLLQACMVPWDCGLGGRRPALMRSEVLCFFTSSNTCEKPGGGGCTHSCLLNAVWLELKDVWMCVLMAAVWPLVSTKGNLKPLSFPPLFCLFQHLSV